MWELHWRATRAASAGIAARAAGDLLGEFPTEVDQLFNEQLPAVGVLGERRDL